MYTTRKITRIIITWLTVLLITVLLLELVLQGFHLVNRTFVIKKTQNKWLTASTRILTLGDSNTYGLYLDQSQSYPSQLEQQWNKQHPDEPIEVINLGYPGTTSHTLLKNLPAILEHFQPDIVLLTIGFNDRFIPTENSSAEHAFGIADNVVQLVRKHSRIYRLYHIFTRRPIKQSDVIYGDPRSPIPFLSAAEAEFLIQQTGMTPQELIATYQAGDKQNRHYQQIEQSLATILAQRNVLPQNTSMQSDEPKGRSIYFNDLQFTLGRPFTYGAAETLEYLEPNLLAISQLIHRSNARLYVLTYGSSWEWYGAVNQELRRATSQLQLPLIDTTIELYKRCHQLPPCSSYFFADFHPNAAGYEIISQEIVTYFDKNAVVSSRHLE